MKKSSSLYLAYFCLSFVPLFSADVTWDGDTDGVWVTGTNWDGDTGPLAADDAVFGVTNVQGVTTIDLGAGQTVNNLEFDGSGNPSYIIGSGGADNQTINLRRIQMGGGSGDQSVDATINLNSNGTIQNFSGNGELDVNGQITGGYQILLQGSRVINLNSTLNDGVGGYTEQTIVQGGATVNANSLSENRLRVRQGTLNLNNDQGFSDIQLGDDQSAGSADGVSTLNIGGSNTVDLANGEGIEYFANTTDAFGNTAVISGGTLQLNSGGLVNVITVADNAQVSGAELTISSNITGATTDDDWRKEGAGTLRIDGTGHTYGGRLVFNQGTIQVEDASALGQKVIFSGGANGDVAIDFVGAGDTDLSEGYRLGNYGSSESTKTNTDGLSILSNKDAGSKVVVSGDLNTNANPRVARTLTLGGDNTEDNEISGVLADINNATTGGTTNLAKEGDGTWILSGDNTFTGTTTVSAGRLVLDDTTALYSGTTADYTESNITVESGATLVFDFDGAGNTWNPFGGGSNTRFFDVFQQLDDAGAGGFEAGSFLGIDVTSGSKLLNQALTDTGDGVLGFVKIGDGVLRMNQNQTYTGGTSIEGGSIELEGNAGVGIAGDIDISSGASLIFDKTADYTLAGVLSGAGSVSTSAGMTNTVSLTSDNTFTAGLNINGGTVEIGAGGTSGDVDSDVVVAAGASFSINRDGSTTAFDFDQDISGDGSVSIAGNTDSVVVLSGTNTYTGGTTINGSGSGGTPSTLRVDTAMALGSGDITLTGTGAQFEIGAAGLDISNNFVVSDTGNIKTVIYEDQSGTSTLSGSIDVQETGGNPFRFTVKGGTGNTLEVTGDISGAGAVSKNFGGNLVLSGTNTYTGETNFNGGLVLINGDSSGATGAVTVENAAGTATLGGTGILGGDVTVGENGSLAPGASVESLEMGALSFTNGSSFDYEIDSTAGTADLAVVNGNLSFDGEVTLVLSDLNPATITLGDTYTLINYGGTWDGDYFTFDSALLEDGDTFSFAGTTWEIDYDALTGGGNFSADYIAGGFINIEAVPEPSAFALIAGLFCSVAILLRRRRR